jgi:hypothetical protein
MPVLHPRTIRGLHEINDVIFRHTTLTPCTSHGALLGAGRGSRCSWTQDTAGPGQHHTETKFLGSRHPGMEAEGLSQGHCSHLWRREHGGGENLRGTRFQPLSIGSAAGVGLMGQAWGIYTFYTHLKWIWAIALGYAVSITLHILMNAALFRP